MRGMVLLVGIIVTSLVFSGFADGQIPYSFPASHPDHGKSHPIHVSDIINTEEFIVSAVENTRARNPELYLRALQKAAEPVSPEFYEVGDERMFYVLKFEDRTGGQYTAGWFDEVNFRLMAIGDKSLIWVSIEEIENEHVTQTEVDAISEALEMSTPESSRGPDKGIFELLTEYFGLPPNIGPGGKGTGEGKTSVLITDIKDGWEPGKGFIAGFFFTLDQNITHNFSNRSDIIYIDSYPGIFNPGTGMRNPNRPLSTLAHEYQHLVFHNYRGTSPDETWLNEGLSEFAEAFCGFGLRSPSRYFSNTNRSMTIWGETTSEEVLQDYSRVALWTMYLWEQLGDEYITKLVQTSTTFGRGIQIVNRAALEVGSDWRFPELFTHFNIANYVQNTAIDPRYGYEYSFTGKPAPRGYHNDPNVNRQGVQISPYASYFVEYSLGDSLEIRFDTSSDLIIKAVEVGPEQINVVPVSPGERYIQYEYGDIYRTILFIVLNTGATTATFNYSSEGGLRYYVDEYKFDDGVPKPFSNQASFLGSPGGEQSIGAGWAVRFTPEYPENQLLSARIYAAFGQEFAGGNVPADAPKSFYFHVWDDNNGQPGEDLIEPFPVETTRQSFPDDFMDIDLYDYADFLTDIQGPVYVGFTHNTEYPVYVGMTNLLNTNRTFAFTGPNHASLPNNWRRMFDLSLTDGTSLQGWNMMMRAVFAVYDPDRREEITDRYELAQNYPNPFNLETRIQFNLPEDGQVAIEIYDMLGRKIKTVVDEFRSEGIHTVTWDATDRYGRVVSSGVYFYRLSAGDATITKKMIFLR
jgi:hypothetical protein